MKRFLEWIGLKEKLHQAKHRAPLVSERDIAKAMEERFSER
jgi:hypothetical protein